MSEKFGDRLAADFDLNHPPQRVDAVGNSLENGLTFGVTVLVDDRDIQTRVFIMGIDAVNRLPGVASTGQPLINRRVIVPNQAALRHHKMLEAHSCKTFFV